MIKNKMSNFLSKLILIISVLKYSLTQTEYEKMLKELNASYGNNNSIEIFAATPNHSPQNCLMVYSPKEIEKKFSGLICFELEVFFQKEKYNETSKLMLSITKIYTAYIKKGIKDLEPSYMKKENGLSILDPFGEVIDWFPRKGYKILILDMHFFKVNNGIYEIKFERLKPGELSIFPLNAKSNDDLENTYSQCNLSENIEVPFILGRLNFTFNICRESPTKDIVLAYNIKIEGNFLDDFKEFIDERFRYQNFVSSIFDLYKYFETYYRHARYIDGIIRLPTATEQAILDENLSSIFKLKDNFFKPRKSFDSNYAYGKDIKFFSDEDYKKHKREKSYRAGDEQHDDYEINWKRNFSREGKKLKFFKSENENSDREIMDSVEKNNIENVSEVDQKHDNEKKKDDDDSNSGYNESSVGIDYENEYHNLDKYEDESKDEETKNGILISHKVIYLLIFISIVVLILDIIYKSYMKEKMVLQE